MALVMLVGLATLMALLSVSSPAGAQNNDSLRCFWQTIPETPNYVLAVVSSGSEESIVFRNDNTGAEQNSAAFLTSVANEPWRPVVVSNGATTVGPLCQQPARVDPPAPAATVEWLPGATAEGPGLRGPARVTWEAARNDGATATRYEFWRTQVVPHPYAKNTYETVEELTFTSQGGTFDINLGLDDRDSTRYTSDSPDKLYARAWWADGVSQTVEIIPPGQTTSFSSGDTDGFRSDPELRITDLAVLRLVGNPEYTWFEWNTPLDSRGQAPDEYHVIEGRNFDGTEPYAQRVVMTFDGTENSGVIPVVNDFWGGTGDLRAVWFDGGPLGGPQALHRSLYNLGSGQQDAVSGFSVSDRTQTTIPVSFTTDKCVYGDYRIAPSGSSRASSFDEFNAPRNGRCYTDHGITFGRDTPPLTPGTGYVITLRLTDPETNEVTFFSSSSIWSTEAPDPEPNPVPVPAPVLRCFGEVATIVGTPGADVIWGTPGRDVIRGLGGNDVIRGLGGDDLICGDNGWDTIMAGDGNDKVFGGNGRDWISGGNGNDRIHGGKHADRLLGNRGWDQLWGNGGNDRLWGHDGNDRLWGQGGSDRLWGYAGDDRIWGGAGEDHLFAGRGRDALWGGDGFDVLQGIRPNDILQS